MEYAKIFISENVLLNRNRGNGLQFFLRIGTIPPVMRSCRVASKNTDYIFEELPIYI